LDAAVILQRVRTTAILVCLGLAALAAAVSRGQARVVLGVLAGGFLVGVSSWLLASGVTDVVDLMMPRTGESVRLARRSRLVMTAKLAGRYALLALLAYVMIARLRLHPLGLMAGASSVVAAVSIEALRLLLKK
jgi:hypothetical protein